MPRFPLTAAALCAAATLPLSACSIVQSSESDEGSGRIQVTSSDDACTLSAPEAPSGTVVFRVENTGSKVTEFDLLGADGLRIVGEVENIGPGLSRDLVTRVAPGRYVTACKPGMVGKGIRDTFTVTDSGRDTSIKGVDQAAIDDATGRYAAYVKDQTDQLVTRTRAFVDAYTHGRDAQARRLYPVARTPWERVETVAESFGDLDSKTDAREADLEPGQEWTGWHRIEKDLWPPAGYRPLSQQQRKEYGDDLLANITTLQQRVRHLTYTVDQIGNGSKGLLDEVATGKITGEEEIWSHTDLYDFQANVDGARVAYETLKPLLQVKDPGLSRTIDRRFADLQRLLDRYRHGDRLASYDTVAPARRKELSDAVNALSEPLSKMTGAITL
jgi:iron uptake system component EfeO